MPCAYILNQEVLFLAVFTEETQILSLVCLLPRAILEFGPFAFWELVSTLRKGGLSGALPILLTEASSPFMESNYLLR